VIHTDRRDAEIGAARFWFGRIATIIRRELAWADDQHAPIPYALTSMGEYVVEKLSWDQLTYVDLLVELEEGTLEPR
jgi:hypothetical protein